MLVLGPAWLALLAPVPPDAVIERKPVASPELLAQGNADAIAGWESLSMHLSDPDFGLRHVLVTLDAEGHRLSASDHTLIEREELRGGRAIRVYDHESLGGRFEADGSFRGTKWVMRSEDQGETEEATMIESTPSTPSPAEVEALNAIVAEIMRRAPARTT